MTQFKENLSVKSIIKPGQIESIHDHEWADVDITVLGAASHVIEITANIGNNTVLTIDKSDAIAIANHFNLLPKPIQNDDCILDHLDAAAIASQYDRIKLGRSNEYINGELVDIVGGE